MASQQNRRIDGAAPDTVCIDNPFDVVLQVRMLESPQLSLADWPLADKPHAITVDSTSTPIVFPRDPVTGVLMPADLVVSVVAPGFQIHGRPQKNLSVPPNGDSEEVSFLLTPLKVGENRRINLEVATAEDKHVGTLPFQTNVATLVVGTGKIAKVSLNVEVEEEGRKFSNREMHDMIPPTSSDTVTVDEGHSDYDLRESLLGKLKDRGFGFIMPPRGDSNFSIENILKSADLKDNSNVTILFVSSSPKDREPLRINEELREIEASISSTSSNALIRCVPKTATRATDIRPALIEYSPKVFHFSGYHGEQHGDILLENEDGNSTSLSQIRLVKMLTKQESLRLVYLNTCFTIETARLLVAKIDCAIGVERLINDDDSIRFAKEFYRWICSARSIGFAFEQASLLTDHLPDDSKPKLCVRSGVDAEKLHLFSN